MQLNSGDGNAIPIYYQASPQPELQLNLHRRWLTKDRPGRIIDGSGNPLPVRRPTGRPYHV